MEKTGRNTTKVLVIDDERLIADTISISLRRLSGFEVLTALSGEKGIELARSESPDIILLDVKMPPGIAGPEVCRRLRSDSSTAEIPIIFLTGNLDIDAMAETVELEAQGFMLKPFSPGDLIDKISEILGLGL
jgi:two-component system phosphate regulon response regulator PhoB